MKQLSALLSKLPKLKINPSYILAGLTVVFVLLSAGMLAGKFILGKEARVNAALDSAQRLEISLINGEIKGRIITTDRKEQVPVATQEDVKSAEVPAENQPATAEQEESSSHADQADWSKDDFIGPKLPEEVINALMEGENKPEIAVETVSIKDISKDPVVVIIMGGVGLSTSSTRDALELPKEITIGFSPYSPSIDEWVAIAKEKGHEIVINIPMETSDYHTDNVGAYALLTGASDEDNQTRMKMLLGLVKDAKAIYSDNTEIFTRSINSVEPVLKFLKDEHKYFIYGGGYSNYSMVQVANSINYPILINDVTLDDEISSEAINDKLREIEKIASEKGYVVVMARPYPITIRMLQAWLPKAAEKGIVIKPVSLMLGKVFK